MNQRRKAKAVALRAQQESYYQPSWALALLALAMALMLAWHGMARADSFSQPAAAQSGQDAEPDAAIDQQPCNDDMDFSPQDNLPDPFDADSIAWHPARHPAFAALTVALDCGGGDLNQLLTA